MITTPRTLVDKIWDEHVVQAGDGAPDLIHIDRHLVHEMMSAKSFADMAHGGYTVRNPELTLCVMDHILATNEGRNDRSFPQGTELVRLLRGNAARHRLNLIDIGNPHQGIVHVIGPELGLTLPGLTLVCCDSHTCTNGGLGALAFGIGSTDAAHVLATQTLAVRRPLNFRINLEGRLQPHVSAKDVVLHLIGRVGAAAGTGYAVEYAGPVVREMSVESRLTLCNMSIELGARIGIVAPDDATFAYLAGRPMAPKGALWDAALDHWRKLFSDDGARFDREETIDVSRLSPQISWGTSPEDVVAIDGAVPDPRDEPDAGRRSAKQRAASYMGVEPGRPLLGARIDNVFIGSCTNARLSDLRVAAGIVKGRKVATSLRAMVVPGSTSVKRQAEAEGLADIFRTAGFEWHESACSMCAAVNADHVAPGARCVSTSNRNFEGRQGTGARTHLASPATAAACAIAGSIADPRSYMGSA